MKLSIKKYAYFLLLDVSGLNLRHDLNHIIKEKSILHFGRMVVRT